MCMRDLGCWACRMAPASPLHAAHHGASSITMNRPRCCWNSRGRRLHPRLLESPVGFGPRVRENRPGLRARMGQRAFRLPLGLLAHSAGEAVRGHKRLAYRRLTLPQRPDLPPKRLQLPVQPSLLLAFAAKVAVGVPTALPPAAGRARRSPSSTSTAGPGVKGPQAKRADARGRSLGRSVPPRLPRRGGGLWRVSAAERARLLCAVGDDHAVSERPLATSTSARWRLRVWYAPGARKRKVRLGLTPGLVESHPEASLQRRIVTGALEGCERSRGAARGGSRRGGGRRQSPTPLHFRPEHWAT